MTMTILMIILALLPLVIQLIELLIARKKSGRSLTAGENKKLGKLLAKLKDLQKAAHDLGCDG